jgi:hypothetical protein
MNNSWIAFLPLFLVIMLTLTEESKTSVEEEKQLITKLFEDEKSVKISTYYKNLISKNKQNNKVSIVNGLYSENYNIYSYSNLSISLNLQNNEQITFSISISVNGEQFIQKSISGSYEIVGNNLILSELVGDSYLLDKNNKTLIIEQNNNNSIKLYSFYKGQDYNMNREL